MSQLPQQTVVLAQQMGTREEKQNSYSLIQKISINLLLKFIEEMPALLINIEASMAAKGMELSEQLVSLEAAQLSKTLQLKQLVGLEVPQPSETPPSKNSSLSSIRFMQASEKSNETKTKENENNNRTIKVSLS